MKGQNVLKREAIVAILKKQAELTDREIAKMVEVEIGSHFVSVSHRTVAAVRKESEEMGIIPRIDPTQRREASGRKARGHKPD